ncbi:fimbrial protein [Atlantibacter sp.]|uniref:fimbrial protein n=1 Tax=Atlantibacter sp. TaxID=1903473 RepID=UPI0028A9F062|nr:fimbrial protein [Atlantibacter sp.]
MKNIKSTLAISALIFSGGVFAAGTTDDTSATLTITGAVNASAHCDLSLSQSTLPVSADIDHLIDQGYKNYDESGPQLLIYLTGGQACSDLVNQGKVVLHFIGEADTSLGTVIRNDDTSAEGARGVGVGIFDSEHTPINLNQNVLKATGQNNSIFLQMVKLRNQTATTGNYQGSLMIQEEQL